MLWPGLLIAVAQAPVARQVAAPASDIESGMVRLPDPAATATTSHAAILPVRFAQDAGAAWAAETSFAVERDGTLALALLSPAAARWRILAAPAGSPLRPVDEGFTVERRIGFAGEMLPGWVIDRRDLRGTRAGFWTVRLESDARSAADDGWLVVSAGADVRATAYVATHRTVADRPIAVVARVEGVDAGAIEHARLVLRSLDVEREVAMFDDGAHEDGAAYDGEFGVFVPDEVRGRVAARVEIGGRTTAGNAFQRSVPLAFTVLEPVLALDGTARASWVDGVRLELEIGAAPLAPPRRLHVSAEVWGRDALGRTIPVCWLSRMLEPVESAGSWALRLELDTRWLDVAGAGEPLELRALRVQDPDTSVVLDALARAELATPPLARAGLRARPAVVPEMLRGSNSALLGPGTQVGPLGEAPEVPWRRSLMLVHGYCSGGSIWPPADFTQPVLEFLDPNANRTHDQFAQLIAQRADLAGLASFGVVAHSQGGAAALHLLTYYDSGLDRAENGRRIQSVATPYQGTPLASLGAFACGVNDNMTPSGAATWLAGIPSWARAQVYTWTTSNSGSACNLLTSLFLTDPEDGTVEKFRGELPGGNNMGHVVGWCHTTGMSNPASYTDHARNQAMDAAAAR